MARTIKSITVERRLLTVPVAGPVGCVTDMDICCLGSGSGGTGSGCTPGCDQCPTMSEAWYIVADGAPDGGALVSWVSAPDDGNFCRFVSTDLRWQMYYDYAEEVWLIIRDAGTSNEAFWIAESLECLDNTTFEEGTAGVGVAHAVPQVSCETTYDCVNGECVPVEGPGGQYPTLDQCNNSCSICCGGVASLGSSASLSFADGSGDLACLDGASATLTYDLITENWKAPPTVLCTKLIQIQVACDPGTGVFTLDMQGGSPIGVSTGAVVSVNCDTKTVVFLVTSDTGTGQSTATVTFP